MANHDVVAHIAYDGPALQDGSMDVRELAPALLGLGDLLQNANKVLNADRATLTVKVQSDFKTGSFEIGLALVQVMMVATSLWGSQTITTARQIAEFVGLVSGADVSLFRFLKWLRGTPPNKTIATDHGNGDVEVQVRGDDNSVNVTIIKRAVYQLAADPVCRKCATDVVKPLRVDGIDVFETRRGSQVIEQVRKEDLPAFELPTPPEQALADIPDRQQIVAVVKPSFDENLTWTLSEGSDSHFDAVMKDPAFIDRVKNGDDFRIGDLLEIRLHVTQTLTPSGLRTRREIKEVIREIKAPRQLDLLPTPQFPHLAPSSKTLSTRPTRKDKGKGKSA